MTRRRVGLAALLAALACARTGSPEPAGPWAGELLPVATPPGPALDPTLAATVVGDVQSTVSSPDGALTLTVPPGAVTEPTQLTVTPIANMARGAIGPAFRLGPEGTTFAAPVTLTFAVPETLTGTSPADVGVEYQDARGFWHRAEPVTRTAGTVSVETTHFSDWALTWQGATAAAEGPITLVQTYSGPGAIPFTATGRATLFFQSDDASDTWYSLTGTLTVGTITPDDGATCVPDAVAKTLPLNLAEVHKDAPPVFRWGIGVTWTLACASGATTRLMPAMFDTMYINLTRCPGAYADGQVVSSDRLAGAYTSDCGVDGGVTAEWDLRTCWEGQVCALADECRLGLTACAAGIQTCVDSGPGYEGEPCAGGAGICTVGVCVEPAG